jgi:hypothetical protein
MRRFVSIGVCLILAGFVQVLNAQQLEIHPYAGGFFPEKVAGVLDVKREGLYGLKGGIFLTDRIEAEGNIGYINDLRLEDTLTRRRAYVWEGLAAFHFTNSPRLYGSFGVGGVTTTVTADSQSFFGPVSSSSDHFLSLSYGGGIKTLRKWGPVGYRADVRGRTLPRFYGFRFSWVEATAGLTFSWGER